MLRQPISNILFAMDGKTTGMKVIYVPKIREMLRRVKNNAKELRNSRNVFRYVLGVLHDQRFNLCGITG